MTETKTIIKVFVASSMQHEEARAKIKEILEKPNMLSSSVIQVYLHEKDGRYSFRAGEDSQEKISAEALMCNAFILYAGDFIGKNTICEFERIFNKSERSYTFIYVIHNPEDYIKDFNPDIHSLWKDFNDEYLIDKERGVNYYELQTNKESLEEHLEIIRDELLSKSLVALDSDRLCYEQMLSAGQQIYRIGSDFYYPRPTDELIAAALDDTDVPLTIVAGESLSGKTKSVVRVLKDMAAGDTPVFFMRGSDVDAAERFMHINIEQQFPRGKRSIFFIDEIDRLLLSDATCSLADNNVPRKFVEMYNFALRDGQRLTIVGSTNCDVDDLLCKLSRVQGYDKEKTRVIDIPAPEYNELLQLVRILRSRNLLPPTTAVAIKSGMPLGALFVDLRTVRSIYDGYMNIGNAVELNETRLLFHAIKSLAMWKFSSENDFHLLLDFYNFLLRKTIDEDELCSRLSRFKEIITVRKEVVESDDFFEEPQTDYSFMVEDIIRDRVVKYDSQTTSEPTDRDYILSAKTIIRYIFRQYENGRSEELFRPLTILFSRLANMVENRPEYSKLFDAVLGKIPVAGLSDRHEPAETEADTHKDWVDIWLGVWAGEMLSRDGSSYSEVSAIMRQRMSQPLLAAVMEYERLNGLPDTVSGLIFENGTLKEEFRTAENKNFSEELIRKFPDFESAMKWVEDRDHDELVLRLIPKALSVPVDIDANLKKCISYSVNLLSERITDVGMVEEMFAMLDRLNEKRLKSGRSVLFADDKEKYFALIKPFVWRKISFSIPSAALIDVFRLLNGIDCGVHADGKIDAYKVQKSMILNQLIAPMLKSDAMECWEAMGDLRDSYTLRAVLEKISDFAEARGVFESFMNTRKEGDLRITLTIINTLLRQARRYGEIENINDYCRRYNIFKDGEKSVLDINDPYTFSALYNLKELSFSEVLDIVTYHKNRFSEAVPRFSDTLGSVINRAPDYKTAEELLFTDEGLKYFTEEEQKLLQESNIVISILIKKISGQDAAEAGERIESLIKAWEADGSLHERLGAEGIHIVNEIINNENICPYDRLPDLISYLRGKGIDPGDNEYFVRHLAKRRIKHFLGCGDRRSAADIANELVLKLASAPREQLRKAVYMRCNLEDKIFKADLNIDERDIYPHVDDKRNWTLTECTMLEFFENMLEHRYASAKALNHILRTLGNRPARLKNGFDRDKTKEQIEELAALAVRKKTFLNHISYISLNNLIGKEGIDIFDLAPEYSVIEHVAGEMSSGKMSRREAEELVRKTGERKGVNIPLTQTFFDFAIRAEALRGRDLDALLEDIKNLPKGIIFSSLMFHTLMRTVRNLDDVYDVEDLYYDSFEPGKAPEIINRFSSFCTSEFTDSKRGIPRENYHDVYRYALNYDYDTGTINPDDTLDSSLVLALMLNKCSPFTLEETMDYIEKNNPVITPQSFYHLIGACRTTRDYEVILPLMPDGVFKIDYIRAIIFKVCDNARKVNWDFLNYFDNDETIEQWRTVMSKAFAKDYQKLVDRLEYIKRKFAHSHRLHTFATRLLKKS